MEDFSVTFLCSRDYIERKFIDDWMMEVVKPHGGSFTIGYRNEYSGSLQLMVYGADGQKPVDDKQRNIAEATIFQCSLKLECEQFNDARWDSELDTEK